MKVKKLFFKECHLAGAMYHDLDEVFEFLRIGTELELVRDLDNRFDKNAVAVVYHKRTASDNSDEEFHIGYIPRDENATIAALLEMGWGNIFKCTICQINPEDHYENQIHMKISIVRNGTENVNI